MSLDGVVGGHPLDPPLARLHLPLEILHQVLLDLEHVADDVELAVAQNHVVAAPRLEAVDVGQVHELDLGGTQVQHLAAADYELGSLRLPFSSGPFLYALQHKHVVFFQKHLPEFSLLLVLNHGQILIRFHTPKVLLYDLPFTLFQGLWFGHIFEQGLLILDRGLL